MITLCLDLSLASAGVAVVENGKLTYTKAFATDRKKELPDRILQFLDYIGGIIKEYKPDVVLIEKFLWGCGSRTNIKSLGSLACLNTSVQIYLKQHKINYKLIAVATVRAKLRKLTGMKKVVKEDIPAIIEQYFTLPKKKKGKGDIADALALYVALNY